MATKQLYAHAKIETAEAVYQPGEVVPADLDGITELKESGAVSSDAYDKDPVLEAKNAARASELESELAVIAAGDSGVGGES